MSIYIDNMDMPTKENTVILISPYGDVWMIGDMPNEDTHLAKARAISVPPHGDLIDRKTAYNSLLDGMVMTGYQSRALDCISDFYVPTIIPAEEGE